MSYYTRQQNRRRSEATEQEILIQWCGWQQSKYPELKLIYHIPNGGSRNTLEAADRVEEAGTLSLTEAREMKQREEAGKEMPGQMSFTEDIMPGVTGEGKEEPAEEEERPTDGAGEVLEGKQENFMDQTESEEYEDHQPEPDQKTAKKLQELQQEGKAQQLPGEEEKRVHKITLEAQKYNEIVDETLTFYLLKNARYRVGDMVIMQEYMAGRTTGRETVIEITYVWEECTGLEDDYCIIGFTVGVNRGEV